MQTPFGELKIFDSHAQFFSHHYLCELAEASGHKPSDGDPLRKISRILEWDMPPEDPVALAQQWVAEMDQRHVDRMVFFSFPFDEMSLHEAILAHKSRITGFATVNPQNPRILGKLETLLGNMKFKGICLFPAMHNFHLDSKEALTVFHVANALRLAVFVHCGAIKTTFRNRLGMPDNFNGHLARPLLLQKIAADHPDVRFIIPGMGAGLFTELLMLADLCDNVYTDTSGINVWAKYLPGQPSPGAMLKQAMDVFGSERILFGTNSGWFPRGWRRDVFEQQTAAMQEAGISEKEAAGIFGGNLARILGIGL